jgi:hypothetical protein
VHIVTVRCASCTGYPRFSRLDPLCNEEKERVFETFIF